MYSHPSQNYSTLGRISKVIVASLISALLIAPSAPTANAAPFGTPYDSNTGAGDVYCTTSGSNTGFFTISNNTIISQTNCAGHVEVPNGVSSIGNYSFLGANQITSLYVPSSVTSIGYQTFTGAYHLYTVTFDPQSTLSSLGYQAFYFTNIRAITFPSTLTSIGDRMFVGTPIESVTFLGPMPSVGGNFHNISGGTAYFQDATSFYSNPNNGNLPYAFGDDWYGLTLSSGVGPLGPQPTITLRDANDTITGTRSVPLTPYALLISSSNPDTITVTSGTFPAGVAIDTVTGEISGTPEESGVFYPTIQVADEFGSASVVVPINILEPFNQTAVLTKVSRVSNPREFTQVGNNTYFIGDDDNLGPVVWITDGTDTGTVMVGISNSPNYASANSLTLWQDGVAFSGQDPNNSYRSTLYYLTNNMENADIIPSAVRPRTYGSQLTFFQNRLYYIASDGSINSVDGDGNSFTSIIPSYAYAFTSVGSRLYYIDDNDGLLYYFNSNSNSVTGISSSPSLTSIWHQTSVGGNLIFAGWDSSNGTALWSLNSQSDVLTKLTSSAISDSSISDRGSSYEKCDSANFCPLSINGGKIYFKVDGYLWVTDGSSTTQLIDIGFNNDHLLGKWINGKLYFSSDLHDGRGNELQEYDPVTNQVNPISDLNRGEANAQIREFGARGGALLLAANDGSNVNLWIYGDAGIDTNPPSNDFNPPSNPPSTIAPAMTIPDPSQKSQISSVDPIFSGSANTLTITFSGTFNEVIQTIQLNGKTISPDDWTQTPTSLSIKLPLGTTGQYSIQIYNGAVPVLPAQLVTISAPAVKTEVTKPAEVAPVVTPTPTPTPSPKPTSSAPARAPSKARTITIKCIKGKTMKMVKGTKPKCPTGYVKK